MTEWKCYALVERLIISENKDRAVSFLEELGVESRCSLEYLGDGDFILELVDRRTLDPVNISVQEYGNKFGESLIEEE